MLNSIKKIKVKAALIIAFLRTKKFNVDQAHQYWATRSDGLENDPSTTLESARLVDHAKLFSRLLASIAGQDHSIFEVGCGIGHNLNQIYHENYSNISGVEINANCSLITQKYFLKLHESNIITYCSAEEYATKFKNNFDVIFSIASLEMMPDISLVSDWMSGSKFIILFETEAIRPNKRQFARNYGKIFGNHGFLDVTHTIAEALPLIESDKGRKLRVLQKMNQEVTN